MKTVKKYTVTIAVNVPAHFEIEVVAGSAAAAEKIVRNDIKKHSWDSEYWANDNDSPDYDLKWEESEELRVIDGSAKPPAPPVSQQPWGDIIGEPL